MAQYRYDGTAPETIWEDDMLTVVRPGDVRGDDPGWGTWTLLEAAESAAEPPAAPPPAGPPASPPPAVTATGTEG